VGGAGLRLEGQAVCKSERLQGGLSTSSLGPYDKNYGRKRLREHALDRTDSESPPGASVVSRGPGSPLTCLSPSSSLPQTLHGLERRLSSAGQHAPVAPQPLHTPAVHVVGELHAAGPRHAEHTRKQRTGVLLWRGGGTSCGAVDQNNKTSRWKSGVHTCSMWLSNRC